MRFFLIIIFSLLCIRGVMVSLVAIDYSAQGELSTFVWERSLASFDDSSYHTSVVQLVETYERQAGIELRPGERKKVGLKVYTSSGPGLATPKSLVRAVVTVLESRGFARHNIFLLDEKAYRLKDAGFIDSVRSEEPTFEGMPVLALDSQRYFDPIWFYENNLPSKERLAKSIRDTRLSYEENPDERKSFLPLPLIAEAEFWINLPMVTDSSAIMVNGVLSNVTLWNISNNQRFFDSPANASVAMAEIAGIPELKHRWVFSILTLERYQYMGGPQFNARYSQKEPKLWLSANPIALDVLMFKRINRARQREGFPVFERQPAFFEYASGVGYGPFEVRALQLRRIERATNKKK